MPYFENISVIIVIAANEKTHREADPISSPLLAVVVVAVPVTIANNFALLSTNQQWLKFYGNWPK